MNDLEIIDLLQSQITQYELKIEEIRQQINNVCSKIEEIDEKILKYSNYDIETISEIIRDLMQQHEGIEYKIMDGVKYKIEGIIVCPKDGIKYGPIFKFPYNKKEIRLKPTKINPNAKDNYVYEFINHLYQVRVDNDLEEIGYDEIKNTLTEYLEEDKILIKKQ